MYLSFSFASAIFQTGSSVSGGLFGNKMAASMDGIQWLETTKTKL